MMDGFDFALSDGPHEAVSDHGLIVDSFAGGGGASTGIEMALARSPDIAINHDPAAMAMHAANHPETLHLSKNIWQVDPLDAVGTKPVALAWFSPDCKHFSKAKGGKPVSKAIRDLAWIAVRWGKQVRPRILFVENVEEFQDWGPLAETEDGRWKPDAVRKGETFARWVAELQRLGYLLRLADAAITVFNVGDHAKLIIEMEMRRRMIRIGSDMADAAGDYGAASVSELLSGFESQLFDMQERGDSSGPKHFSHHLKASIDLANAAYMSDERIVGVPSSIDALDRMTGGLGRGDVTVIAGRPSMGKSALSRWIAFSAAQKGYGALIISMEMSGEQLSQRSISDALRRKGIKIPYIFARKGFKDDRGERSESCFQEWIRAAREIESVPLEIDDTAVMSPASLRRSVARVANRMRRRDGELQLVLIDYLQLLESDGRDTGSRVAELTKITKSIKQIAKFYNVHIIMACQLSRKVEEREEKTPQLADLRESGSIEQDADNVIGILRPEYYLSRSKPQDPVKLGEWEQDMAAVKNTARLAVLKVRNGPVGMVECKAEVAYDWFDNLPEQEEISF